METFEFNEQRLAQSAVDIDNIGQFAIRAVDINAACYFLLVRTDLGVSTIVSFGPVIPDTEINEPLDGYSASIIRIEYKETRLKKFISTWLNDTSKNLLDAEEVDVFYAIDQVFDLKKYLPALFDQPADFSA